MSEGEKVEIRVSSPWTNFNITNQMQFENIIFTGEDLFASASYLTYSSMGQWNLLAFMPFKKCKIHDEPGSLSTIDELRLETLNYVPLAGFEYSCINRFNKTASEPPYEVDNRCFTPEYKVSP